MKRTLLPSRRLRCGYFGWNKCPHQPECQTCISMLTFPKLNFPVKAAPSPNSNTSSFIVAKELLPPDARRIYRNQSQKKRKSDRLLFCSQLNSVKEVRFLKIEKSTFANKVESSRNAQRRYYWLP